MINRVNLVPPRPLSETIKSVTVPVVILCLVLALSPVCVGFVGNAAKIRGLEAQRARLEKEASVARRARERFNRLNAEIKALQQEHTAIDAEIQSLSRVERIVPPLSETIRTISGALPREARLSALSAGLTGALVEGEIRGVRAIAGFIETLKTTGLFSSVELTDLSLDPKEGETRLYRFKVQLAYKSGNHGGEGVNGVSPNAGRRGQ